ncbi:sugar ABC transporter permease [Pullulanibacillus sp. KACC 23026]|uniref:carbohydrate ABC transporter permease n=1 Tax=Pullulanibacillus sp. KACC 23026 TaxID=3028315 RepID=UPI0023AF818C|nr:sugar ABC transporter permease [Pullulanibacillus sp. KACC 23026]WEG14682.1 sugar ABC transporter permease [Pullulanibacillus sp. KACC 23026]
MGLEIATKQANQKTIRSRRNKRDGLRAILFLFPTWVLLLVFFFLPIVLTFYYAFTNMSLTGVGSAHTQFIGFANFTAMFKDPSFRISVINTIIFLLLSAIVGQQVLGLIIALLMDEKKRWFRSLIGILVIAGWVTPEIVVAFIWFAFLNTSGTLDVTLGWFGIKPISWLTSFPMVSVIVANVWHGTAFSMLVYQAALGDVPKDIQEAAKIDGASGWQRLWKITIPMIRGSIVTNMVLITLQTLGLFTLIYALTGGGPGTSTETLPIYMYQAAFSSYQLGYGTAISLILLLIGIIFSVGYIKVSKVNL